MVRTPRCGSGMRVSASFQIFALTAGGNVLDGEGDCPAGEMSGGLCPTKKCPTLVVEYAHVQNVTSNHLRTPVRNTVWSAARPLTSSLKIVH